MQRWTVYAWLSANESESKRIYCFNLKIRICNWNERIKKELICSLESLNFSVKKIEWVDIKIHFLTYAHTPLERDQINRMNEWMNEHTYAKVFGLVWPCMRVTPCFLSLLSSSFHSHARSRSRSLSYTRIIISLVAQTCTYIWNSSDLHSNNSITTWIVHTNCKHELNTKWHKFLHWS